MTMSSIWRSIWSIIGSVPLWLKIMGIVVFPLLLVVSVVVVYIRQEILSFLVDQGYQEVLPDLYPLLTHQAALALSTAVLVGIILAYGLSLILSEPFRQLIIVIRQIEEGDLSARINVWARDEIGRVQKAFNDMAANLEGNHNALLYYNQQLLAVNELAEAVTLGRGVDAVIETALSRIVTLMEANVGSIYLLDEDLARLKLKACQGFLSPELMETIANICHDEAPMEHVITTGRALAVEDVRTAPEIPVDLAALLSRDGFIAWACAPLKMEGEVIGVYQVGKRGRRSFSSHDLALLEVMGNVVGFSISNAQLLKDLRHKEAEIRRALHRAVELQEDERKRLARELHDEVGQALTSILIRLKTIQEKQEFEAVVDRLDDLRTLTAQTIEELRRLSMDLHPVVLDNLGIVPALTWYIQQAAERSGLNIQFIGPEKFERLSPDIEVILYRVAQEGLTNAIRHARAEQITVCLEEETHSVRLIIADNGQGFNPAVLERGLGLIGIRERVELLNGNVGVDTAPGAGTRLWIEIPTMR